MDMLENYALIKAIKTLRFKELSVRELAREAKIGIGTSKDSLDYLLKSKIVKRNIVGRSHYYKIDLDNFLSRNIKIFFSLKELNNLGIVEEILSKYHTVTSIILFGSVARGDDDDKSDIDVLIISRKENNKRSLEGENKLNRELSLINYTINEWRDKSRTDKVFYDRVILDGIVLYGNKPMVN